MIDDLPETRLASMGMTLPESGGAVGAYAEAVRHGDMLWLSGKGPRKADGSRRQGKVGAGVTVEEAREDARTAGLNLLAALRREAGTLDRVARIVKMTGFVNAVPDFADHPRVIDACSELLIEVMGPRGVHARSALGAGSLPNGMTVEVEMVARLEQDIPD